MTSLRSAAQVMKMKLAMIFSSWDIERANIGLMRSIVMVHERWIRYREKDIGGVCYGYHDNGKKR
ncbi:hypothetical protein [Xenorhabdus littoralis]|uniref:hypothetical protein n=1 Tax=Xenorhabdus littoralis TaxID=2582835 RepID=UPI0029E7DA59|nr:hypothetical protein [Xenorhabdus sp. psl]MDX7992033.1 hypothetical protein [Xenorhabdus sp. psl]